MNAFDLEYALFNGILYQARRVPGLKFFQQIPAMGVHGPNANEKFLGYFNIGMLLGDQPEYFNFAITERSGVIIFG